MMMSINFVTLSHVTIVVSNRVCAVQKVASFQVVGVEG